jgi:hypothetical protein
MNGEVRGFCGGCNQKGDGKNLAQPCCPFSPMTLRRPAHHMLHTYQTLQFINFHHSITLYSVLKSIVIYGGLQKVVYQSQPGVFGYRLLFTDFLQSLVIAEASFV